MFDEWQRDLLDRSPVARLATIAPDGRPRIVPACFALVGGHIAIAVDEKPKRSTRLARLNDLSRDPRCSLLVDHYETDWSRLAWVRLDALGDVLDRGDLWSEALAALRRRYPQYIEMELESRPMLRLAIQRVAAWRASAPD